MTDDSLVRLVHSVVRLSDLSGARFVIIGGVARGVWARLRATEDVDVIIDRPVPDLALKYAAPAGLVAVPEEIVALARSGMTRLRLPDKLTGRTRLDVLTADHPFYERVVGRARPMVVFGHSVLVASPEDILLLKVLADRSQDRADVDAIVDSQRGSLDLELIRREAAILELELPPALRA